MKRVNIIIITTFLPLILVFSYSACSSLSRASINGDIPKIKSLLKEGKDINKIDKWGWTPLAWATYYQYHPTVEFLLKNGADPNIQIHKGYGSILKGSTPLVIASYYGKARIVQMLLNHGARPNIVNVSGYSPMYYAKRYSFRQVIALLLHKGGRMSIPSNQPDKARPGNQTIILNDGSILVGKILKQSRTRVTIKTKYTTMTVKKAEIKEIKYK